MERWEVPGQERAVGVVRGAVERGEVSHAWAFVGPGGAGQERLTRWLAAALNCDEPQPPCGRCSTCRRCLRGIHPAVEEFAPTGTFHRVDDVRQHWVPAAFRTAAEGRWKVLRIVEAERMNEPAANAFLKALEEPPERTAWVLDVADPQELPDTILSRCRLVHFRAWTADALEREARRRGLSDEADVALAVRAALGSPLTLARLAEPGGLDDFREHRSIPARLREQGPGVALLAARAVDEEVKRRAAALKAEGKAELDALADQMGDDVPRGTARQLADRLARRERETQSATLAAALDDLLAWYRDCLVLARGGAGEQLVNADAEEAVRADAEALGAGGVLRGCDLVLAAREHLELNTQSKLTLEALFLELSALTRGA